MLQITDNPTWISFSEDLKKLNLRFPNAELQKTLGFETAQISNYVRGKKMPSQKFLEKFYEVYEETLSDIDDKLYNTIPSPEVMNLFKEDGSLYKQLCAKCEAKDKEIIELKAQVSMLKELLKSKK